MNEINICNALIEEVAYCGHNPEKKNCNQAHIITMAMEKRVRENTGRVTYIGGSFHKEITNKKGGENADKVKTMNLWFL